VAAPKANQNRLKYGIYAKQIPVHEDDQLGLMPPDKNQSELDLARVRLKEVILKQAAAPPEQWIQYEKVITRYVTVIASLTHRNALLSQDGKAAFMTVMEMIRQVNQDQDVK
jgi:hypothetical protein